MSISAANVGGVADPRLGHESEVIGTRRESAVFRGASSAPGEGDNYLYTDQSISFENYHFWANRSREVEKKISTNAGYAQILNVITGKKNPNPLHEVNSDGNSGNVPSPPNEKVAHAYPGGAATDRFGITESEWENAQRATRTATWGTIFYLITTDILGPYNVPWAISQMGYGPGVALYTVFGVTAYYSGMQLWKIYIGLDSTRYPMRNYGDVAFRVFGNWARIGVNILQSFQFFLNVTLLIESNGMGLAQMAAGASGNGFLCFIVAEIIFMLAGFLLGQIRTLQRLGFLANLAVWLNVICVIMTMAVTSKYGPNYEASEQSYDTVPNQPIQATGYWPPDSQLTDRINGLMNGVFAYGGATLFNELLAEMRRPWDFWKSLLIADIFIYLIYMCMGLVVYTYQGQYTFNPAYQGIPNSAYAWQTLGNAINFISGLIAALLYGNIGIKVFYAFVLRDIFRLPALDQKKGKWIWVAVVPVYWGLAFIVAAAIPQISNLTAFVGAACILQFTYTFPPILMVGYNCQKDAILPEEEFDPATGSSQRVDSGLKRWMRGYRKRFALNTIDVIYFFCALSAAGLGIYASVLGMHESFASGKLTPFTCAPPTG